MLCMIHRILLILSAVRFSANESHQILIFVLLKELLLRMTKRILLSIKNFPYHIMEGNGVGNHRLQHLIGLTDPRGGMDSEILLRSVPTVFFSPSRHDPGVQASRSNHGFSSGWLVEMRLCRVD